MNVQKLERVGDQFARQKSSVDVAVGGQHAFDEVLGQNSVLRAVRKKVRGGADPIATSTTG